MVLWICVAAVLVGLGVLAVLLVELRAKQRRLQGALDAARPEIEQATLIVAALSAAQESVHTRAGQPTDTDEEPRPASAHRG